MAAQNLVLEVLWARNGFLDYARGAVNDMVTYKNIITMKVQLIGRK
jgi:hypothetical protein